MRSNRALWISLCGLATACLMTMVPGRTAADRPSLAQLEADLQTMRDESCAKADADGDSYRPIYCAPACSCAGATPAAANACQEVATGHYLASRQVSGICLSNSCTYPDLPCVDDSDCPPGGDWSCQPGVPMVVDYCVRYPTTCTDDPGCDLSLPLVELTGVGVPGSPGVAQCRTGTVGDPPSPADAAPVNSADALACIATLESQIGQPCTPAP